MPRPDLERRIKDLQSEAVAIWKRDMRTDIRASYKLVKKADITNANIAKFEFSPEEAASLKKSGFLEGQIPELTVDLRPRIDPAGAEAGAGAGSAAAAAIKGKPGGGRKTRNKRNKRNSLKRKTRKNRYL